MQVKDHTLGWKGLHRIVKEHADAINRNQPIEGTGIRITSTPKGKLIEVSPGGGGGGGGGSAPNWVTISILNHTDGQIYKLDVWAKGDPYDPQPCTTAAALASS